MSIKIVSYNVNGIRSANRKGLLEWVAEADPDIICFQELKSTEVDAKKELDIPEAYETYWHPAEKKGYSGVAIWSKEKPLHVEYGCGIERYDREGRCLRLDFEKFSVISLYLPSGSSGDERQEFKEEFLDDFYEYIGQLKKEIPNLVISGDYNICHQAIDIHNPVSNKKSSGFLPQEREWVTKFLEMGFVDSFREFHPEPDRYSWWSFRAASRKRNKGWRIDYHMVADSLKDYLVDADIHNEAVHSDHAPLSVTLNF